eukprot:scaffold304890_cov17-Tisochrysis_lutea.AAC.1
MQSLHGKERLHMPGFEETFDLWAPMYDVHTTAPAPSITATTTSYIDFGEGNAITLKKRRHQPSLGAATQGAALTRPQNHPEINRNVGHDVRNAKHH